MNRLLPAVFTWAVGPVMGVAVQVGVGVKVGVEVAVGVRLGVGLGIIVGVAEGARVGAVVAVVESAAASLSSATVVVRGRVGVAWGGGPPKAPVMGVSGGEVSSSARSSRVGLGRMTTLSNCEVGVGDRFAAAVVTIPVPIGTPATKKPIASKIRAKAYPVSERKEKGRFPRRAKAGV